MPGASGDRRLLALQELDLSVDRLRSRRTQLEAQGDVREARERTAGAETVVGEAKLDIDELTREQTRLETEVDSMRRKMDAERRRLFDGSVANAKELQSIEAEVGNLQRRISDREDNLLELMERLEELEGRRQTAEADLAEARDRLAEIEVSSGRELVEVERALAQREGERAAMTPSIDPELLELYEDLRRQKKGVGAAALVDGVCQGCHQKMSAVYLDRLGRTEGIRRCEYCRRILVLD